MLFILFGPTAKMGHDTRNYFKERGFEIIEKLNYIPEGNIMVTRHGTRTCVSKEEVEMCDFKYQNNGISVGFNKTQILDAVRGKKNCLLSLSSYTMDFIQQIKVAYGGYVTVIYTYIDQHTLTELTTAFDDITPEEIESRLTTGKYIKELYLKHQSVFDEVLIYGGENSQFDTESLYRQVDRMIERAEQRERQLNDRNYVELPYSGPKDYIFVSYSHADQEQVFPILATLQRNSCRVWYDEGIRGGDNWNSLLATKIADCSTFLLFSSANSAASDEVSYEINGARRCKRKILTVRLDEAQFPLHHQMFLDNFQYLDADRIDFERSLIDAIDPSIRE